jgi:Zn ribbon nucleic-acid-binding protein
VGGLTLFDPANGFMTHICPICQANQTTPFYSKNGYTIVECAACRMRFVSPMPTPAELTAHYQNAAYFEGESEQGYLNYADMQKALRPHFQRRLQMLESHLRTLALFTWRGIRIFGWGWQKAAHRSDDIFATLEALGV